MRCIISLYAVFGFIIFTACKKQDFCKEPPKTDGTCELAESDVHYKSDKPYTRMQFRKYYDQNGLVTSVRAGNFDYGLKQTITMVVKKESNAIYFLRNGTSSDTIVTASFNAAGKLTKITTANSLWTSANFIYSQNRLAQINILDNTDPAPHLYTKYDTKGNIIELRDSADGSFEFVSYAYDTSVTATVQFYSDDFIYYRHNTLYLAAFMGWLPDLMPKNKRIRTSISNNEYALTNHVYDKEGRLLSYDGGSTTDGLPLQFINSWSCDGK